MRVVTVLLALACSAAAIADQAPAPAGVKFGNTGHHHLLVDAELPSDLTLQLLFADFTPTPFTPNLASKKITITVAK
jgi:hypothetical protein